MSTREITITLGRSSQIVKRKRTDFDKFLVEGAGGKKEEAEAPVNATGLLNSLGLGKYAIHFEAEEVDMTVLKQMDEKDLKELGIPMGPRKKIIQALSALFKRLSRATVVR